MNYNDIHKRLYDVLKRQPSYEFWKPLLDRSSYDGLDLFLYSEVGFDSLDMIEFIIAINKEFDIKVDEYIFDKNITLRKIINYLENELH